VARSVKEWIGRTNDDKIPDRVRVRVYHLSGGHCATCTQRTTLSWECDHILSLINGGEHRESNLQVLCGGCHKEKTAEDVAVKAKTYAIQKRHLGLKKSKGRPIPGTKRSGLRRRMDGTVERR
jgi:5-methylcytosine-specific restriction enzyme A